MLHEYTRVAEAAATQAVWHELLPLATNQHSPECSKYHR